ncbi:MAG: cell envelope-related transcriptional attenuator [Firmicutes bacterium]|nr:cell envelope-related transcriptional attenuator [Bacillota bacterium]
MRDDREIKDVKRNPKKRRRIRWGRIFIFVIILITFIGTLAWASYSAYVVLKDVYTNYSMILDDFQKKKEIQTKFQNEKFNNYTNILLVGIDEGDPNILGSARRADTIVVLSIQHNDGSIRLLSIPRDTQVGIPGIENLDTIKQSYAYGGTQLVLRTVEEFLQIPINQFIVMDSKAFIDIVDTVGGLDLYVENDMDYEDPEAQFQIHLKKGFQHLDGNAADQYVRYCSDELGDVSRVQRQQRFLKAFCEQMISTDKLVKIPNGIKVANNQVMTSITMLDAVKIMKNLKNFSPELIKTEMLPGSTVNISGMNYWKPDQEAIGKILEDMFKAESNDDSTNQNNAKK